MNTLKTTFLMGLLTVLLVILGGALGGRSGMTFAFLMAGGMNFFSTHPPIPERVARLQEMSRTQSY